MLDRRLIDLRRRSRVDHVDLESAVLGVVPAVDDLTVGLSVRGTRLHRRYKMNKSTC